MISNALKLAIRRILGQKNLSIISVLGLTLGITVALFIAHIAFFEFSFDRFNKDYKNIYRIQNNRIYSDIEDKSAGCPPALGPVLKKEIPEIIESARLNRYPSSFTNIIFSYTDKQQKKSFFLEDVFYADNSFLNIFSFRFLYGDSKRALEAPRTAVITKSFAEQYFGNIDAVGKNFEIENDYGVENFTVSAIIENVPANCHVQFNFLLSLPTLAAYRQEINNTWGWNAFNTYIRILPGSSVHAIKSKLEKIISDYDLSAEDYKRIFELQPLSRIHLHSKLRQEPGINGSSLLIDSLVALAIFILVVAWLNYINISLAKSAKRISETYIKRIHGISIKQLFLENSIEAILINLFAVIFSLELISILKVLLNKYFSFSIHPVPARYWILLSLILLSGAVSSGVYPCFASSKLPLNTLSNRLKLPEIRSILKDKFIIIQLVISITFMIATFIGFKQLSFMIKADLGFSTNKTLSFKSPKINGISSDELQLLKEKLSVNPQIVSFTTSSTIPGKEYSNASSGIRRAIDNPDKGKRCFFIRVDENYFKFFNINLMKGRDFSSELSTERNSVILNEEAMHTLGYLNPEDAIGDKIVYGGLGGQIKTVVGIVSNYHHKSLKEAIEPIMFDYNESGSYYSIKTASDDYPSIFRQLEKDWNQIFPNQPFEYIDIDIFYKSLYYDYSLFVNMLRIFTVIMILIACLGLFALAYYSSLNKIKEIGIRKVHGARVSDLIIMLNIDYVKWVIFSFLIAAPATWLIMHQWLKSFAYKTNLSWWLFVLGGIITMVIALLTVSWQSWRAATKNPVEALRYE